MWINSAQQQLAKAEGGRRRNGFTLLECLAYGGLLVLISGLSFAAYFRCLDHSRVLRRSAEDIVRVLRAGEDWRKDIRGAAQVLVSTNQLEIVQSNGSIRYVFKQNAVWRQSSTAQIRILGDVKESRMAPDPRQHLTAWRWDLELVSRNTTTRIRPLFTFQAVPAQNNAK